SVSYPVVITKASDTSITQASDLKGKSSANSSGSNWGAIAQKYGATVNPVSQFMDAVAAVKAGRVDLTVNDQLAALDYFNTTHDTKVKIALKLTGDKVSQGIAFRKGSGLLPAVNQAIAELRQDGTLALIGQKYFGEDVSK
ncbi:MAG: transporter substrate-binding domain-containing protein, partial [Bifidobacteriaceae bacterium]|nr:transporter substrate-binding domain-containing protein [Bifidobacteriaceae bacterium]